MSTTVTLSVDGEQREVTALASTVGDVLEAEGVEVGPRDIVAPSPDEEIEEGTAITVRYGRPLDLVVDGEDETHWVTATTSSPTPWPRSAPTSAAPTCRPAAA